MLLSFSTSVSGSQMHCLSAVLPVEFPDTSESTDSHLSKRYPFVFVLVGKDSEGSCLAICRKVENGRISGRDFQLYYIGAQRILRELQVCCSHQIDVFNRLCRIFMETWCRKKAKKLLQAQRKRMQRIASV